MTESLITDSCGLKQIRDSIYNYIPLSPLEYRLLNTPGVLRLHRIIHNSTLFNTYPCNKSSRFCHSIGAMNIAGEMFKHLVQNSNTEFLIQLHKSTRDLLAQMGTNELEYVKTYLDGIGRRNGTYQFMALYGVNEQKVNEQRDNIDKKEIKDLNKYYQTINCLLFQAIRLAALAHDIGHPPYSHVLEFALSDLGSDQKLGRDENGEIVQKITDLKTEFENIIKTYAGINAYIGNNEPIKLKGAPIHEMIGIKLIKELIIDENLDIPKETEEYKFFTSCLIIAMRILSIDQLPYYSDEDFFRIANTSPDITNWIILGYIINGQVDCDRIDYMLRDPKSSGLPELCSFDYIRIINLITPIKQEKIIGESTYTFYVPGFDRRALSSLTDFFNDRVRQYRWLTNHHNVVKTDMVMTRLIILLADLYDEVSNDNNHPISSYLHDNHFESLWNWTNLHQDYRYVDDAWLDTLLLGLLKKVLSISNDENFDNYRSDIEECEILLKVLYDRKNYLLKPLWKRIDDFIPFATEFSQQFQINVKRKFNGIKKKEDRDQLHPSISKFYVEEDVEVDEIFYTNQILEQWSKNTFNLSPYSKMKRVENRISEDFPDIRFVLKIVIPYKEVLMLMKDETIKPLHKLSNLVANLSSISKNDLMLYAYVMNTNENNYDSNIDLCFLGKKMADALFQLFLEDQKKDSRS